MGDNQDFTQDYTDANGEFQSNANESCFEEQNYESNENLIQETLDQTNGVEGNEIQVEANDTAVEELQEIPIDSGSADIPGKDDDRKLFVGGLSWETTEKDLRDHFGQYGEIESVNVKTDPNTGRSRGFAFVVFKNIEAVDLVINAGDHIVNGKKVDPKKAKAKQGKIFVGGLSLELTDDEIKNHFAQFGSIIDVELPFDKIKNLRKGFCFITFESENIINEILKNPKQLINGKEVDVKKATPKQDGGILARGARGGTRGTVRGTRGTRSRGGWSQGWGSSGYSSYPYNSYAGYGTYDYGYGSGYGGYSGYDYYGNYNYGYGGYDSGYGYDQTGYSSRTVATRGKTQTTFAGKTRGGRPPQRHQPY